MYHYISEPPAGTGKIRQDLSVPPERFAAHLRVLREHGYTAITLDDLALALQVGEPLPEKPVILTFDDGYRDHYEHAFPLLREYGYSGTFFLVTGMIDEGHPDYVTWEQVIEMDAGGMAMEAHGYTHVDLRKRSADYLVWQVLGAKEAIEARTNKPVRFFCYPSGWYDAMTVRVLHSAHYWGAVTTRSGAEHHSERMFEMPRIRVHGHYEAHHLLAAISAFMNE
jgi:peptidoglycan/xylan/chitin deacetylase (PgdA/CDA1 family)